MKKYFFLSAVVLVIVLIFVKFVMSKADIQDLPLETVSLRTFDIKVNTVGMLDAERAHMVSSTIKGDKGKIIYIIDDGTMVKAGDVLLRFDATPFEADVLRLTGELKSRNAVVEATTQVLEWEKSQAEGGVKNAEFNRQDAKQEYSRYMSYIKDLEDLGKRGFTYPNEISLAKKKADQLNAKLDKAETDVEQVLKEGVFKVAAAMAALNKAKSELETTKLALEDARSELDKTVVKAPFPGIVVLYELFRDNQKRKPRVGDTVWQNQPLLYLPDISSMIVKTQVREVDLHKISVGQKVAVKVDAYPDVLFEGQVISIGVLGNDGAEGGRSEKYFQLSIVVKGKDTRLRPGMTARVFILTDTVKDVLTIPLQAVYNENGRNYCFIYSGKKFRKAQVSLGRQNEDVAEILSGIKKGDRVSLVRPHQEEPKQ